MANWGANHGANHGAFSYGHFGADLKSYLSTDYLGSIWNGYGRIR